MNNFLAINLCEGFEPEEYDGQVLEAWQYLHDTRLAYQLQGFYGRTCQDLLQSGLITDNLVTCN